MVRILRRFPITAWLRLIVSGILRARTLGLAAEVSFWVFLALVPLAAVTGMVAARVVTSRPWIATSLESSVPPAARALVAGQVQQVAAWQGRTVAPIALVVFVWLASTGVHAVFDALEVQSGVARPWWRKRLLALGTCLGLSVGVGLLGLLSAGLNAMQALAGQTLPAWLLRAEHGPVGELLRWFLARLVAVGMIAALYRVGIPRNERRRVVVLPGAVLAVVLQSAFGWGYKAYVAKMGTGDAYQAGLAVVGVTLMTLWLFSVSLLLGAQLNAVLGECAVGRDEPFNAPRADTSAGRSTKPAQVGAAARAAR
jgi:membrane protein